MEEVKKHWGPIVQGHDSESGPQLISFNSKDDFVIIRLGSRLTDTELESIVQKINEVINAAILDTFKEIIESKNK